VIRGKVYDVTKFLDEHPGGDEVLNDVAGMFLSHNVVVTIESFRKRKLKNVLGFLFVCLVVVWV
jgi:hypothetical protein